VTVMKFNGANWVNVGTQDFSSGESNFTNIAFSQSGQPFVAFEDADNSNKAVVMKFDG